ncbi:hypothetical protein WICPIJ_004377 [Wickerhamomyces pijperi]|uniref:Potassium transport protein n=1 Tax=Wickerhamomyces pijperi TaxID=599730 RepID=A0A9P8TMU6_WICPI|nr:hypothetical protein WICPIJ_004377 [Wickerhamomyces pijperi]
MTLKSTVTDAIPPGSTDINSSSNSSSNPILNHDRSIGWIIRDFVATCEEKLGPYLKWLFPSFIVVHYFYIVIMLILCSIMIYPVKNMSYIDALFFAAGASTQAGLNTVDLNDITLYQQVVIYVTCCFTASIFVHSSLCFLRLYWFERYFDNIRSSSKLNSQMRRTATTVTNTSLLDRQRSLDVRSQNHVHFTDQEDNVIHPQNGTSSESETDTGPIVTRAGSGDSTSSQERQEVTPRDIYMSISMLRDQGTNQVATGNHRDCEISEDFDEDQGPALIIKGPSEREMKTNEDNITTTTHNVLQRTMSTHYLSWIPQVGRNSTFVNLTDQQKEELGGVEYRALKILVKILASYFLIFQLLAVIFLVPWIWSLTGYRQEVTGFGVGATWWGFFTAMSSFANLGFTLTPNSMQSFNSSPYALLVSAFFIISGNTGFPIFLRFIIWVMFKLFRGPSLMKESLGFLLDHPRRCFTLLFPSAPTWWLLFVLLVLNITDLILFIVLDLNSSAVESLSTGQKILGGFYQAVSTRTAGFSCVDLSQLRPAVQLSYMVMMYISVLPIAISIRRTNVYEEQSLGIFAVSPQGNVKRINSAANHETNEATERKNAKSFIGAHLRKQLSFDLWFIVLAVFIICIAEGGKIQDEKQGGFDIWHIIFEAVSAYGTVGLSLGFPGTNSSFSSQFSVVSKLVMIVLMIRGRHRGLPYSLDRAIMLPSKQMEMHDLAQNLHNRADSVNSETLGNGQPADEANDGPVLQFFKSLSPEPIRNHIIKNPNVLLKKDPTSVIRKPKPTIHKKPESGPFDESSPEGKNDYEFEELDFSKDDYNIMTAENDLESSKNI